jgi:hypothetical protein
MRDTMRHKDGSHCSDRSQCRRAHLMAPDEPSLSPFDRHCADALADEVAALVRHGVLDSRSPAADALLDYRNPPSSPRADRLAELEAALAAERQRAEKAIAELRSFPRHAIDTPPSATRPANDSK